MLHSLEEYVYTQQPFILSPPCIFVTCILILVAITVMSLPQKRSRIPSHLLHLPFNPIEAASLTLADQVAPASMARSRSHPCLSAQAQAPVKARTLHRSPSHNTFLNGRSSPLQRLPTATLSDEELNRRFSAFIQTRFAAMKQEMLEH